MANPQDKNPQTQQGSTRIVAGQPAKYARPRGLKIGIAAAVLALIGGGAAVASSVNSGAPAATQEGAPAGNPAAELKLGYFGNVTHAPALVGVSKGFIKDELGGTKLSTQVFNAGPAAIEALNAGAIDATYIGPNPAINSFVKSQGQSVNIIAGAAAGGAQLVVKPDILFMDEPFSALDALMNLRMRNELLRVLQEERHTVLLITHDVDEAVYLADRIMVLSPRPARIQASFAIDLPHPRKLSSPQAQSLKDKVLAELGL